MGPKSGGFEPATEIVLGEKLNEVASALPHTFVRLALLGGDNGLPALQMTRVAPRKSRKRLLKALQKAALFFPDYGRTEPLLLTRRLAKQRGLLRRASQPVFGAPGLQTLAVVPFWFSGRSGVVEIGEQRRRRPSSRSLADFEPQLVRTLLATADRQARLLLLEEALRALRPGLSPVHLHELILRSASRLAGLNSGALLVRRQAQRTYEVVSVRGEFAPELRGRRLPDWQGLVGKVTNEGRASALTNKAVSLWRGAEDRSYGSAAAFPMKMNGATEAVLLLTDSRVRVFDSWEIQLIERFAEHAAVTLETLRLSATPPNEVRGLKVLQQLSNFSRNRSSLGDTLRLILTAITARYGLGFNRAALFLVNDTRDGLLGRMGVGEIDEESARQAWAADRADGLTDFASFDRAVASETLRPSALEALIPDLFLPLEPAPEPGHQTENRDIFSEVMLSGSARLVTEGEHGRLPKAFVNTFEPGGNVALVRLESGAESIGLLACDNKYSGVTLTEDSLENLALFAQSAAVAVQNARFRERSERAQRRLDSLFGAGETLLRAPSAQEALDSLMAETRQAAEAQWVELILLDPRNLPKAPIVAFARREPAQSSEINVRPNGMSMKVAKTGAPIIIQDVDKEATEIPVNPIFFERGVKAAVCLPWLWREKAIGVMWIHYTQPRQLPQDFINDLTRFVKNAAKLWEDVDRLRRAQSLRKVLQRVTVTNVLGDLERTLDEIAGGIFEVLECDAVCLYAYYPQTDEFKVSRNMPGVRAPDAVTCPPTEADDKFLRLMLKQDQPYKVDNVLEDRHFRETRFSREEQIVSAMAVPLESRGEKRGLLFINYRRSHPFSLDEEETVRLFAQQAAVAVGTAVKDNTVLQLSEELLNCMFEGQAVDTAARKTAELMKVPIVTLAMPDRTGVLLVAGGVGWDDIDPRHRILKPGTESHAGYVMEKRETIKVPDFEQETRFNSPFWRKMGARSAMGVPMRTQNEVVGALLVATKEPHQFSEDDERTLGLIANLAAITIRSIQRAAAVDKSRAHQTALGLATRAIKDSTTHQRAPMLRLLLKETLSFLAELNTPGNILGTAQTYHEPTRCLTFEAFWPEDRFSAERRDKGRQVFLPDSIPPTRGTDPIGITGLCALTGKPQRIGRGLAEYPHYRPSNPGVLSEIAVPMLDNGRVVGVLNVESDQQDAFDQEVERTLVALADLGVMILRTAGGQEQFTQLSHDMFQPMTRIKVAVQAILRGAYDEQQRMPQLEAVDEDLRHLQQLTENIFILTVMREGALKLNMEILNVTAIVDGVLKMVRRDASAKRLSIDARLSNALFARVDRLSMERILSNLLDNALKFTPPGGKVEVVLESQGSELRIAVSDSGPGIPREQQSRIWEDYYQIPADRRVSGVGIGLSIVRRSTMAQGGRVNVDSEPGRGTTIEVFFLRADQDAQQPSA